MSQSREMKKTDRHDTIVGEMNVLFRQRYETLRMLLTRNGVALRLLADLEADLNHLPSLDSLIRCPVERLQDETLLMAQELNVISHNRHKQLYTALERIRGEIRRTFGQKEEKRSMPLSIDLMDATATDSARVGGKAAGLAAIRHLFPEAMLPGFVITPAAYRQFLSDNRLAEKVRSLVRDLDVTTDRHRFSEITETIRELIRSVDIPPDIVRTIIDNAEKIERSGAENPVQHGWAVRSSAIGEDGRLTFAGQFETMLRVSGEDLVNAYREVLASRFSERAVMYRIHGGFREVDTPMAVLFMPMLEPRFSGVLLSSDIRIQEDSRDRMVLNVIPGSGEAIVQGTIDADTVILTIEKDSVTEVHIETRQERTAEYLDSRILKTIGEMAVTIRNERGHEIEIEWAVEKEGRIRLLQCRRLKKQDRSHLDADTVKRMLPLIDGGVTINPGRAEGHITLALDGNLSVLEPGSILVVDQPTPEMSRFLPGLSAFVAVRGNPTDHMATLAREFSIPCIYQLGEAAHRLVAGSTISIDATRRKIYEGSVWPDIQKRMQNRLQDRERTPRSGPLFELVTALNLTQPFSPDFTIAGIHSLHDAIRFIHEMAVRSMFRFADEQDSLWKRRTAKLDTVIPLKIRLLDLEHRIPADQKSVRPDEIGSLPFQAFWQGMGDQKIPWSDRWKSVMAGISQEYQEQILGGTQGPRRRGDPNYCIFAHDYLNFNARFAYHYAMVDAMVGIHDHLNYIHFRFHNGGASLEQRKRRVKFLELILREHGFGVDSREDLLIAWFRQYPQPESERALATIGRLLVCSRQLDVVMVHDNEVQRYARYFLDGKFEYFA